MRETSHPRGRFPIASHPIFKPALIGWAGLVVALVILILPEQLIARLALATGLSILADNARYILAIIGGVIGGGIGFAIAVFVKSSLTRDQADIANDTQTNTQTEYSIDEDGEIQPIDPVAELGSDSLDAPIEQARFEEIAEANPSAVDLASDPSSAQDPISAGGRRRGLTQIVRSERAPETPDLNAPNCGADAVEMDAAETDFGPEQDAHLSDGSETVPAPIESEVAQEAKSDNAETVSADDTSTEHKIGLPDAVGAQSALDALIQSAHAEGEDANPLATAEVDGKPEFSDPPRALDLDEFAALPGRNAVWVQESTDAQSEDQKLEPAPEQEPVTHQAKTPSSANTGVSTALARLRATPIEELNMVQMIERLAAALEDRKSAIQANPDTIADPERKHALAEGLKTLSAMANGNGPEIANLGDDSVSENAVEQESAKLRDALDKLADLRGAA